MPVTSTTRKQTNIGNGATTSFPITFPFLKPTNIKVVASANGVETAMAYGVDYTVSGTNCIFTTAPASGVTLIIYRVTDRTRETDYQENGLMSAQALDDDFDRAVMVNQEQQEDISRTTQSSITEASGYQIPGREAMKGNYLAFDPDTGDPIPAPGPMGGGPWSQYANYVVGDIINVGEVQYIALTNNRNKAPASNPTDWKEYHDPAHAANLNLLNAKGWNGKEKVINGDFAKGSYGWTLGTGAKVRQQGWVLKATGSSGPNDIQSSAFFTLPVGTGRAYSFIAQMNKGTSAGGTQILCALQTFTAGDVLVDNIILSVPLSDPLGYIQKTSTGLIGDTATKAMLIFDTPSQTSGTAYCGYIYASVNGVPVTQNGDFADGATGWTLATNATITYDPSTAYMGNAMPGGSGQTLVVGSSTSSVYVSEDGWENCSPGETYVLTDYAKVLSPSTGTFRVYIDGRRADNSTYSIKNTYHQPTEVNWTVANNTFTIPSDVVAFRVTFSTSTDDGLWLVGSVSVKKLITASEVDPKQIATVWENWRTYEANTPVFFEGEPYEPNPADMPSAGQSPADTPAKWLKTGGGGGSVGNIAPDPTGAKGGVNWTGTVSTVANTPPGTALTGFPTELKITADSVQTIPIPTQLRGEALELRFEAFLNAGTNVTVKMYSDAGATVEIPMTQTGLNPTGKTAFVGQFWAPGATVYLKVAGTGEDLRMTNIFIGRPETVQGAVVSAWMPYPAGTYSVAGTANTATVSAGKVPLIQATTNPTKGTPAEDLAEFRRNEGNIELHIKFKGGTGYVNGSGNLAIPMPLGFTFRDSNADTISADLQTNNANTSGTMAGFYLPKAKYFGNNGFKFVVESGTAATWMSTGAEAGIDLWISIPCAQFTSSMTVVGMNEPFFLSNSESVVNTNGVAAKTQIGTWAPILANTAATYYDLTLPRPLMLGEKPKIILRSKVDGSCVPAEIAGINSLEINNMVAHYVDVGGSVNSRRAPIRIEKPTAGQIRVRFETSVVGVASGVLVGRSWDQIRTAADGYDAWMVEISRGGEAWAVPPKVVAIGALGDGQNGVAPGANLPMNLTVTTDNTGSITTGASWKFTSPVSQWYSVSFNSNNTNGPSIVRIWKNGVSYQKVAGSTNTNDVGGEVVLWLNKGEYIDFRPAAAYTFNAVTFNIKGIGS